MRKIWIVSFLAVVALSVTIWLARDPIIASITRWQIGRIALHAFGQELRTSRVERSGRKLTFHQPTFATGGQVEVVADALEVAVHIHPLRLDFHVNLLVTAPHVTLAKLGLQPPKVEWRLPQSSTLISPSIEWEVQGGSLELIDGDRSRLLPLTAGGRDGRLVWCRSGGLSAQLAADGEGVTVELGSDGSDLTSIALLVNAFNPTLLKGWEMVEGALSGHLVARCPTDGALSCEGAIELHNWGVCHRASKLTGVFERATLVLDGGVGHLELSDGGRLSCDHAALPSWNLDLSAGALALEPDQLSGTVEGLLTFAESASGLRADANIRFTPSFEMALELGWDSPGPAAKSHLHWSGIGGDWSRLDLELVRVGREQAAMIQALADEWLPDLLEFDILRGNFSAGIEMELFKGTPHSVKVSDLVLDDLALRSTQVDAEASVSTASGAFEATLADCGLLCDLSGEITIDGGAVRYGKGERVEEIHGSLRTLHSKVEVIDLSAHYRGIAATCRLHPMTSQSQIVVTLEALGLDLERWLPEAYRLPFTTQFSGDTIAMRAQLTPDQDTLHVSGECSVDPFGDRAPEALELTADFDLNYARNPSEHLSWRGVLLGVLDGRDDPKSGSCSGLSLKGGTLHGHGLPLDRYAPVLALLEPAYAIKGIAEMVGTFDTSRLSVAYEAQNVTFETPLFRVEVASIGDLSRLDDRPDLSPVHKVDFQAGAQAGLIPILASKCWIRAGDLWFTDVGGVVHLNGPNVHVSAITADAEGVHFEGELDLDRSSPGVSILRLSSPIAYGPAHAAQTVCAHYSGMALWDLPLKGSVETREDGLQLLFHFYPDHSHLDLTASGWLRHGGWTSPSGTLALSDLDLSFDYDHIPHLLRLGAADGDLIQQLDGDSLHYSLVTHEAVVTDLDRGYGTFDIELYCDEERVAHVAGSALPTDPNHPEGTMELSIDPVHSYLGHLQPSLHVCTLNGWSDPKAVSGNLAFDLETIEQDAALLHLINVPFPTPKQLRSVGGEECYGLLSGRFQLREGEGWSLSLAGDSVAIRGHLIHHLETRGGWQDGRWLIDELVADELRLSAQIVEEADEWRIDRLTFHWSEGLDFTLLEPTRGAWSPIDGLRLYTGHGAIGDLPIGWQEVVLAPNGGYGAIDRLTFEAELAGAERLLTLLGKDPSLLQHIVPAQRLAGSASMRWDDSPLHLEIDFADGDYRIREQWWSLSQFQLILDHSALSLSACTPLFDHPYWVTLTTTPSDMRWGRLCLSHFQGLDQPHIAIDWLYDEKRGVEVQRAVGSLQGFHLNLVSQPSEHRKDYLLRGQIGFDGRSPLLPPTIRDVLAKLDVGRGYWLDGIFHIPHARPADLSFHGILSGTNVHLGGVTLQELTSHLTFSPNRAVLTDFAIHDPAIEIAIERLTLENDSIDGWSFSLPSATITGGVLDGLRVDRELPKRLRALEIPRAELRHFAGNLLDRNSWSGRGFLKFDSPSSTRQTTGILSIPAEIIGRLGLEGGSLTPAMGTVRYRISNGRIVLTDFKDVYSRNRYSQFLLASRREKATIDFDGNLNIPLRMKQNNLLMKFTEMFLISVQGTVAQPQVSLKDPKRQAWR